MIPHDRSLRLDLAAASYLDALERDDFDTMALLWQQAAADTELEAALREVHIGLIEEQQLTAFAAASAIVVEAVDRHLPSGEMVRPTVGPLRVADVAEELFRHTPDRLPAHAHQLTEKLRSSTEPLPLDLGLSKLVAWAEERFGAAPAEYWRAFRQAALKLELRRSAEAEYHLAARPAPPKSEESP
jgi:hypothetical protein